MEAKLLFFYYVGEINLRVNRPREAEKRYGGVQCLVGVCCGEDSIAHIMQCFGYQTKVPQNFREEYLGEYLMNIHQERMKRWEAPLISSDLSSILSS